MSKARPTSVMILGYEFEIRYVDDMPDGQQGEMTGDYRLIKIDAAQKGEELLATVMHEIIHAALFLTGWSEKLGAEEEEGIVRALEHTLAPLYQLKRTKS